MKKLLFLALGALFSFTTVARAEDVSANKLAEILKADKNIVVIDIRTPSEFSAGHVKGAININLNDNDFDAKISKLDKDKTYAFYCRSGARSARALPTFQKYNLKFYHMNKGMNSVNGSSLETSK